MRGAATSTPFRLLLITDTHGEIDAIDDVARAQRADACLHCGDFGLYDAESVARLPVRELRLRILHSGVASEIRQHAARMSREECAEVIRREGLMSQLVPYLAGEKSFAVPVLAVWGNHEDFDVVRDLRGGRRRVGNLRLLDEACCYEPLAGVRVLGIGGNFLPEGKDFFAPGPVHDHGQIRSSWVQFARLLAREAARPPVGWRILVTHVSPGKARLLERFALALGASHSVSGHMGPPILQSYSLFTVREPSEALERSRADFERLRERWAVHRARAGLEAEDVAAVDASLAGLDLIPPAGSGRRPAPGSLGDRIRRTVFLNLPDGACNWTVLEIGEGGATLASCATFRGPR